jgi:hypothetical protein
MTKNKLIIIILSAICLLVVFQFYYGKKQQIERLYKKFYLELKSSNILDDRFNPVMKNIFTDIKNKMGIDKKVLVNSMYKNDSLCVYIYNHRTVKRAIENKSLSDRTAKILAASFDNFTALPPNIVLIDSKFLGLLLLLNYNSQLGIAQAIPDSIPSDFSNRARYIKESHTLNIIDNYLRFANIEAYRDENRWYSELDSIFTVMARVFAGLETKTKNITEIVSSNIFVPYFLTIVSHELAHLEIESNEIRGWDSLDDYIQNIPYMHIQQEERKADEIAFQLINKTLSGSSDSINIQSLFYIQGVIEFAETLRDLVLVEIFDGFHGLKAKDVLFYVEEKYPLDENLKSLSFVNAERVEVAIWREAPIMTKDELEDIIKRLKQKGSSLTHQHLLLRGREILQIARDKITFIPDTFYGYDKLLTTSFASENALEEIVSALHDEEVLAMQRKETFPSRGLGINISDIISPFKGFEPPFKEFELTEALPINGQRTWVGKSGNSYIEIWGSDDNINKAIYTRHFIPQRSDEEKALDMMHTLIFLLIFVPELNQNEILNLHAEFMDGFFKGFHPTIKWRINGKGVIMSTINESQFFRISVEAVN